MIRHFVSVCQSYLGGRVWPEDRLDMGPGGPADEDEEAADDNTLGEPLQVAHHPARLHSSWHCNGKTSLSTVPQISEKKKSLYTVHSHTNFRKEEKLTHKQSWKFWYHGWPYPQWVGYWIQCHSNTHGSAIGFDRSDIQQLDIMSNQADRELSSSNMPGLSLNGWGKQSKMVQEKN